jgi:hypothetical protein
MPLIGLIGGNAGVQFGIEQLSRSSPATFDYMKKLLAAEK